MNERQLVTLRLWVQQPLVKEDERNGPLITVFVTAVRRTIHLAQSHGASNTPEPIDETGKVSKSNKRTQFSQAYTSVPTCI